MPSYIPSKDAAFDAFFSNIVSYVLARVLAAPPVWTHIPKAAAEGLAAEYSAWHEAYEAVLAPHTAVQTAEKTRRRAVSQKALETFVNRFLRYDPAVTNADRDAMGIPNTKKTHTRIEPPPTRPVLIIDTSIQSRIIIHYRDEGSARRGKPPKVHGIEVRWAILDHAPADREEIVHSAFDTRSPLTLQFDEHDRGKRLYLYGQWEIEREGEKGPPGVIVDAVIP
jgi:hypothetical protein